MKTTALNTKKWLPVTLILILMGILGACDRNRFYDRTLALPEEGWHKDSVAVFSISVEDTNRLYDFYITLRNTDDYEFRNFYLFLITKLPNSHVTRDTLELILADKKGKWMGKGFGAVKDNQILIRENLKFPISGDYRFGIEQAMRKEKLKGITDIGIRIETIK